MDAANPEALTTPSEPDRSRWAAPIGMGLALLGLSVLAIAFISWVGSGAGWAYDFHAYYDAALRLIATGTPYQEMTLGGPFQPGPYGLYLYSPVLAILFVPLTWLGEQPALFLWLALRVGILVMTCALLPVSRPLRLAALGIAALSAPFLLDLNLGNVSLIVTFLAVVTWRWLDKPLGSVAVAASVMVRPTMAIIAGWWLLRGRWRPLLWTVVAVAVFFVATLPFVGLDGWIDYLTVLRNINGVTGVRNNVDLGTSALLLGAPMWLAQIALYAGYVTAAVAVLLSLRRDRELSYVVTVMASLLVAPLLWDHYLTMLLIPAAFLASRGRAWGIVLPLLAWAPLIVGVWMPDQREAAGFVYPLLVLIGMLLPFAAPSHGEPAGTLLDGARTRAPA